MTIIYLNWNFLTGKWLEGFNLLNQGENKILVGLTSVYYTFGSFYGVIFLLMPLSVFEKKHKKEEKLIFKIPRKTDTRFYLKNILIFFVFPLLLIIGIVLWMFIEVESTYLAYVFCLIVTVALILSLVYTIFKKVLKIK
ncbi:hypothetical protein SAMN05660866_03427 [Maribacter arcticus]|uniref:Uncharacterized protein n=1 Tax=Maribacter arcticus TaxID=561365 RepID=A0A1T5EDA6_9FLAO|nr:hypothetical protein SAMN05660866_03427 [Maribacter arcticus]